MLLARWLCRAPQLLLLDEPTRGIDVGARGEIQARVRELGDAGMTLVLATGGVDRSVGSVMALAAGVAAAVMPHGGPWAAGVAGLAAGAGVGLFNGRVITRYRIEPFVAALGTMTATRGLAQAACGGGAVPLDSPGFEAALGKGFVGPVPVPVVLAASAVLVAAFVLKATPLGRYLLAVGGNAGAARASGVPVQKSVALAFAGSGALAGLAGLADAARLGAADPGEPRRDDGVHRRRRGGDRRDAPAQRAGGRGRSARRSACSS